MHILIIGKTNENKMKNVENIPIKKHKNYCNIIKEMI